MRPARRRLIALCAAALACARPEAPSEPTVALRYGWPAGLAAEVDVHSTRIQLIGGTHKRGEVRSSYRLATAAEGSGLRVQFLDAKFWFDPGEAPASHEQGELIAEFSQLPPEIVVDEEGVLTAVPDLAGHRERLLNVLAMNAPTVSDAARARIAQRVLNDDVVRFNAARHWGGLVAAWIRGELVLGTRYAYSKREPNPVFPGETQETQYALSATKLLPCTRGGRALTCVELELQMRADPTVVERLMADAFRDVVPPRPGEAPATYSNPSLERIQRVVAEPDGLIPHAYVYSEIIKGVLVFRGRSDAFEREVRSEYTFRYADAPSGG